MHGCTGAAQTAIAMPPMLWRLPSYKFWCLVRLVSLKVGWLWPVLWLGFLLGAFTKAQRQVNYTQVLSCWLAAVVEWGLLLLGMCVFWEVHSIIWWWLQCLSSAWTIVLSALAEGLWPQALVLLEQHLCPTDQTLRTDMFSAEGEGP